MPGGLRIALVHPFPFTEVRRGGERYVWDLAEYLGRRGHDVEVLTGTDGVPGRRRVGSVTFRAVRHRQPRALRLVHGGKEDTFAASVLRATMGAGFDLVHAFTPQAALAARASGHAVVYTSLGAPRREWLRTQPAIAYPLFWSAVRSATEVTALSTWAADQVAATTGRVPNVLPPGVDLAAFPARTRNPCGPPTVLFASDASEPAKRADVVLEALVPLADRHPGVRLRFGGPGDHRWALGSVGSVGSLGSLGDRAREIESRVDVLGVGDAPDLPSRYRDATVTVLASAGEAFGLVLVESLASGTPVVCADAAGPRDIVDDPAIGRRFRPDDPADLARALDECIALAADPATPARCAAHAARWGWAEHVGPAHEDLYRGIRRRRRRSG